VADKKSINSTTRPDGQVPEEELAWEPTPLETQPEFDADAPRRVTEVGPGTAEEMAGLLAETDDFLNLPPLETNPGNEEFSPEQLKHIARLEKKPLALAREAAARHRRRRGARDQQRGSAHRARGRAVLAGREESHAAVSAAGEDRRACGAARAGARPRSRRAHRKNAHASARRRRGSGDDDG